MDNTKPSFKLTDKEKLHIVILYNKGWSTRKIAEKYKLNKTGIYQLLKRRNVKFRSTSHKWYSADESFFETINTEEKAYILGFLYGDGTNHTKNSKISIVGLKSDMQIFKDIRKSLKSNNKFYFKENKKTKTQYIELTIYNKKISKDLENLGMANHKTYTIKFPNFISKDLIRHFIRGYFDADGCFTFCQQTNKKNNIYYAGRIFICGTENICQCIKDIFINELNINNTKLSTDKRCYSNFRTFTCGKLDDLINIYNFMYKDSNIYLKRKKMNFEKYFKIKKIII